MFTRLVNELDMLEGIEARHLNLSSSVDVSEFCKSFDALSGLILNAGVTNFDKFKTGNFDIDAALVQTDIMAYL